MCFELDSEPPIPKISGAAVSHDDLVLESSDGNRFAAFRATPDAGISTGVVILPDVRGLYRFVTGKLFGDDVGFAAVGAPDAGESAVEIPELVAVRAAAQLRVPCE